MLAGLLGNRSDPERELAQLEEALAFWHQRMKPGKPGVDGKVDGSLRTGTTAAAGAAGAGQGKDADTEGLHPCPRAHPAVHPHDRYLGKVLKNNIFPKLADDLEEFFEGGCSEALLTGGIGWGKPRFAEIAIAYDIYQVSRQGRQRSCPTMIRGNVNAGSPVSILDVLPMRLLYG